MQTSVTTAPAHPGRLLYGLKAIANYLGITERQARHLHDKDKLPTRKEGKRVFASRDALDRWIADPAAGQPDATGTDKAPGHE
ncbi:helix-turn-helix domain-containing protein [Azospirillum brasilense]|uniref:helix-turn-helix domain-containing protein n=1 Tax=Azospirillum brasilense TaxID=192 RepID=UPI001EDA30E0|nr:helix-turn-helix domain-containing protein [Azospirillum brasilense]UKJ74499.1 helix-turn-helix domain-containing protein [Azospirillum brasilense]